MVSGVVLTAGTPSQISNPSLEQLDGQVFPWQFAKELMDAGLTREELTRHYAAEVDLGKCTITFRRRKECWAVRSGVGPR